MIMRIFLQPNLREPGPFLSHAVIQLVYRVDTATEKTFSVFLSVALKSPLRHKGPFTQYDLACDWSS